MKNTLQKTTKVSYIPGSPYVPASPGQPYLPARTVIESRTVCGYRAVGGGSYQWVQDDAGQWHYVLKPGTALGYEYVCRTESVPVSYPAQPYVAPTPPRPAVPAQTIIDHQIGWNARARSIEVFAADGRVAFQVPRSTTGAVVGLSTTHRTSGYADIKFAFYCSHGVARIMESGQEVQYIGAYADSAEFQIRRYGGRIWYSIDGTPVRDVANNDEPMHLDAALYTGGDAVTEPSIVPETTSHTSFQPLTGAGGEGAYAFSHTSFQPLTGSSRPFEQSHTSFQLLTGLASDRPYATSATSFQPLSGEAEGGFVVPSYAISETAFSPMTGSASMLCGTVASSATSFQPLTGLSSDRPYATSATSLQPLTGYADDYDHGEEVRLMPLAVAFGVQNTQAHIAVAFTATGEISAVFAFGVAYSEQFLGTGQMAADFALQAIMQASVIGLGGATPFVPQEANNTEVWVLNAETGGFTRYENYPFNSFAKINGVYYGCREDGIYRLDGADDNGQPVQAMVSFGKQDFGTSALKRVTNAYLGLSSGGRVFLKVIANGEAYTYAARSSDPNLMTQRIDIGRGLRANHIEFELYNSDGDDFELASVEFAAVPMSRRI